MPQWPEDTRHRRHSGDVGGWRRRGRACDGTRRAMSTRAALNDLRSNGERLWNTLMEMAEIGKAASGGCTRVAFTDEDKEGQELFIKWAEAAGCRIARDRIGN